MGKLLFAAVVAIASFALVESLTCNQCSISLLGFCLSSSQPTCAANETCYTEKFYFPALTSFKGVIRQGCRANDTICGISNSSTILSVQIKTDVACCDTDKCNTVDLTGAAPDLKMTFLVTMVGAAMASMWGSFL
ncbi:uncharacterized protein LOC106958212 isoform X1 [Poecilia latipinna]|uniref:uncharacterized protein LOC106958212 isoform X1 n=1 Tax=Poecilia latipinna TaxID=48699 RepID=UPI00072E99E1|nr:PREDICTED: uncharacterized protein LOC106958212 isoform X1 [Poecilia latipinna]